MNAFAPSVTLAPANTSNAGRAAVADAFSVSELLGTMLQLVAAMARGFGTLGTISEAAAQTIANTCRLELFDAEQLARDTLRSDAAKAPPLIARLRDMVELFSPQAARQVFLGGNWQRLQIDALLLLSRQHAALLAREVAGVVRLLEPSAATQAARLRRALERIQQLEPHALRLRLPTSEPAALTQRDVFMRQLHRTLGLEQPTLADLADVPLSQMDDWVALGLEYALLALCVADIANGLCLPSELRGTFRLQAHRVPLLSAQWMNDLPTFDLDGPQGHITFWNLIWPQWTQLCAQTLSLVRAAHAALDHQEKPF